MDVGERIKSIRKYKKISTQELSRITGISQPVLSRLENGKRSLELNLLKKVSEALDVSLEYLMNGTSSFISRVNYIMEKDKLSLYEISKIIGLKADLLEEIMIKNDNITFEKYKNAIESIIKNCSIDYFFDFSEFNQGIKVTCYDSEIKENKYREKFKILGLYALPAEEYEELVNFFKEPAARKYLQVSREAFEAGISPDSLLEYVRTVKKAANKNSGNNEK